MVHLFRRHLVPYALIGLGLSALQLSCVSYTPRAYNTRPLHSGAVALTPGWDGKITFWGRAWPFFIGPVLAGSAGAIYYQTDPTSFQNKTTGQRNPLGSAIVVSGLMGVFVPGYLPFSLFRKRSLKPRPYDASQADQWARQYKGNWQVYRTQDNNLIIGPRGGLSAYDAEEKAILERADRQRREAEERVRQAAIDKELAVYEAVRKEGKWQAYLDQYPNGIHSAEVNRTGEQMALLAVIAGRDKAATTYLRYFPAGLNGDLVRKVRGDFDRVDNLREAYYEADTHDQYKRLLEQIGQEITNLTAKKDSSTGDIQRIYKNLSTSLSSTQSMVTVLFDKKIKERAKRQERMATWVIGDNLCWTPASYSADENGKRIPNSESQTKIRVSIEEINPDHSRFKVRIKELYNVKKERSVNSFRMSAANRNWEIEELDWIDPLSEEMDFDKCL